MKKTLFAFMALAATFAVISCQSNEELTLTDKKFKTEFPFGQGEEAATGIGKVKWVQLWKDGPKFAEYNVGASSVTEIGTTMTFTEATKADVEYVWGANWCTPSKEDMEHLITATNGETDDKVKCEYTKIGSQYGFKFTGLTDGYTDNSVFFPIQEGNRYYGYADYWSATADAATADGIGMWSMNLFYNYGLWDSQWYLGGQDNGYLVRPVLKN